MKKKTSSINNLLFSIRESHWTGIFIVLLALVSVALLIFELSSHLLPDQVALIQKIDIIIALTFLFDFLLGMYFAKSKMEYFQKNWTDLLSAIPISEGIFRSLRILRILRLVRVIRIIARLKKIGSIADKIADHSSVYIYAVAITTVVILSGAIGFYSMEFDVNPQVKNFFDAIWWAVVTATTVGYGDIYPVTWEGRIIGMILMFFGIGLVGTVAGTVSSYFLNRKSGK